MGGGGGGEGGGLVLACYSIAAVQGCAVVLVGQHRLVGCSTQNNTNFLHFPSPNACCYGYPHLQRADTLRVTADLAAGVLAVRRLCSLECL